MAIYCIKIKYTSEAIKGMMEVGAHRADAIRSLTEVLGVKLSAFTEWLSSIIMYGKFRGTRICELEC